MAVELNHTIVAARSREESAGFLAGILGLEVGPPFGRFLPVETANGVTLDFADSDDEHIPAQHYAFLITEKEFDGCLERIGAAGVTFYPDPRLSQPGELNRRDGGRGLYFRDPTGHVMEILTRPYGSG
jgi:catechol 2,3-dioxygenase-like lactoylglutathione lyase family enzyme